MNASPEINEIAAALARAQAVMESAKKGSVNPHFHSKYADLAAIVDAIRQPFAAHGLSYVQLPQPTGPEEVAVETVLLHSSGQWISSLFAIPVSRPDAHGRMSALTYCRRGALAAISGIASDEDDDGNAAANRKPEEPVGSAPMRNAETANAFMPRAKPVVERQPAPPARPVARKKPPVVEVLDPDPPEELPEDRTRDEAPPAEEEAGPLTVFTIGGTTYATKGITQEQMLTTYELVPQVDREKGRGTSRALLTQTAGVATRTDLTEAQADRYIAALRGLLAG